MKLSCPLGTARRVPREKFSRKPNNKPFIDKAFSVKLAGYWPRPFFCEFMDARVWTETESTSINTQKELGQYQAILTLRLVITHMYLLELSLAWNFQCSRTITFAYTGPSETWQGLHSCHQDAMVSAEAYKPHNLLRPPLADRNFQPLSRTSRAKTIVSVVCA